MTNINLLFSKEEGTTILAKDTRVGQYLWVEDDDINMFEFSKITEINYVGKKVCFYVSDSGWRIQKQDTTPVVILDLDSDLRQHKIPVLAHHSARFEFMMQMINQFAEDIDSLDSPFTEFSKDFSDLAEKMNNLLSQTKCFSAPPERVDEFENML